MDNNIAAIGQLWSELLDNALLLFLSKYGAFVWIPSQRNTGICRIDMLPSWPARATGGDIDLARCIAMPCIIGSRYA